jgi:hypothetical protein
MEMQQMTERLSALQEQMMTDMKAIQARTKAIRGKLDVH